MTGIINAGDKDLTQTFNNLPQVGDVIISWFQPLTFDKITKTLVDGETVETSETIETRGVRQPAGAERLKMLPEGQRSWKVQSLWCLPDAVLKNDDIVIFAGVKYRVLQKIDWAQYGYLEYLITETFTQAAQNG
jgi:hypothetical protein